MPRASETSKASGRDLIGQVQDIWQEHRDQIPGQQRRELGQVLTELGNRITYACQGQQPESRSKYATLGGSELASHAQKTVQRVTSQLPMESWSDKLTLTVNEMANRVRYTAEGESSQTQQGQDFDFSREEQKQTHTFA